MIRFRRRALAIRFRRPPATPPENVRAVMADGSEIPLEVIYAGWDGQVHQWKAVIVLGQVPAELRVGMLPARTAVGVSACR